jgi:CRISPR-associated protein Csm1
MISHPGKSIVKCGIDLLCKGKICIDDFVEVFRLAGVQTKVLQLASLKSSFGGGMYFAPKALTPNDINYPVHGPVADFISINDIKPKNNEQNLNALERYGSYVATDADSQVSVYDLFKTVAAIQDCLEYGDKNNPFLLVSADFSGIQDTVYTISSKGALKTLRARSFMLELLTEHIVYEILQKCGSERYAVIYSGGGGFSLLIPNREGNSKAIEKFKDVLNRWAYKEFCGKFFIALDVLPFDKSKLDKKELFIGLRQDQSDNLDRLKRRKFLNEFLFTDSDGAEDGLFVAKMPRQLTVQTECQISRRDDLPSSAMRDLESGTFMDNKTVQNPNDDKWTWVSESCFHQFKLGDRLIEGYPFICRSNVQLEETPKNFGHLKFPTTASDLQNIKYCWYYLSQKRDVLYAYWQINSWEDNGTPIFYANYVRKHGDLSEYAQSVELKAIQCDGRKVESSEEIKNDTATFEGLSASSCGANLIGALRMDVDDMGNLFSSIGTFTELSAKSRMLNIFFKVYLNEVCRGELGRGIEPTDIVRKNYKGKGRNISVIYSGGDDLFILGAWDETTELAFDIQRSFALFSGGTLDNDKNTVIGGCGISGGITLHQPKFPLYQMAKKSGEAEHWAKQDYDIRYGDATKNRIALFYDSSKLQRRSKILNPERYMLSMTWDLGSDFLLPLMKLYRELGRLNQPAGCFVFEIEKFSYQTIEKWFAVIEKYQESFNLYLPTMARVMKQLEDNPKMDIDLFKILLGFLYTNDDGKKNWISHLHIALNWLSFLRRTK